MIACAGAISTAWPFSLPSTNAILFCPCGASTLRVLHWRAAYTGKRLKKIESQRGNRGRGVCRAELVHDAPFVAAIGACFLTSLVSPVRSAGSDDEDAGGAMDSTDTRLGVMAIVGFIPYFNWLSWVFAWLDTDRPRYILYSIAYFAPYLRTNLSLSPDESWLPIASIVVCIIHIQLEVSIRNGDLDGLAFFEEALKLFPPFIVKKDPPFQSDHESSKGSSRKCDRLPQSAEESRDRFREWGKDQNEGNDGNSPQKKND